MALRNNANEFKDEALNKLLFEYQLSNNKSYAQKELKSDIQASMFIKFKDVFSEFDKNVLLPVIAIYAKNGFQTSPEYERELSKREDAFDIHKKLQYASKHNKISSEDFFNYLEDKHQNIKNYIHDPLAWSDLRQTEYYKHIDEIIYETTKLKEKYVKLKNDEKALLHYLTKDYTKEVFA